MPSLQPHPAPTSRRLRIFSFDPSVAGRYDSAGIGEIVIKVPWEILEPGPVGEYIEVVDVDPASDAFYPPVDLNDSRLLAQDGLAPAESNPQFHQQMVYAVAMTTIGHFERALGRVALWASHSVRFPGGDYDEYFVPRLRIYPHALRDRNAYYSPQKKALIFGYFPVALKDKQNAPGTLVFTCLSHDIVAHETTHALLDGVHPRFNEPVNADVLAFHEAFADMVALFQHFSFPGVLRDQIARTRGDLANENMLAQLAQQFGQASGRGTALRDALGQINPKTKRWEPIDPDPHVLDRLAEPHARGAILVAAVFRAFSTVYRARTRDLYRIATEGTGVLREGDIHPDLAHRLADEAARCAAYVLQMCIRAIDYCPPVGITFGDYLRGIITADYDLNPEDELGYRLAFVESFRQWGIYPRGMRSMSIESLLWPSGEQVAAEEGVDIEASQIAALFDKPRPPDVSQSRMSVTRTSQPQSLSAIWDLESDRKTIWSDIDRNAIGIWTWLIQGEGEGWAKVFGLVLHSKAAQATVARKGGKIATEIHSVRFAQRRGMKGQVVTDLVVEFTQRRAGYFDNATQAKADAGKRLPKGAKPDFMYRAGSTVLIDRTKFQVRRVIRTPGTVTDPDEFERLRAFLEDGGLEPTNAFDSAMARFDPREPFALLHQHGED
jgi:hypothetical protein